MRPAKLVTSPLTLKVASLAGLVLLAACHGDPNETAPQCPQPYLLPDASSVTKFGPRGTDLTDLVLTGRMLDIKGACGGILGGKHVTAHAHVELVATRGPAATGNTADLPYSVGIVRNGQVLEAHHYVEHVIFPPNVNTVQLPGQEVTFDFPTLKGVSGPSYHIYFYFDLSPAELARNRAH